MAARTVGEAVSAALLPSYFYLLLTPQGRTACERPRKPCYHPESLLDGFVPVLTWFCGALLKCHLLRFAQMSPSRVQLSFSSAFTILPVLNFLILFPPTEKNKFLECKHLGVLCVYYHISEPITVTVFFPMKESTYVSFLGQAGHKVSPAKICSGVLGTSHATFPDFSRRPGQ